MEEEDFSANLGISRRTLIRRGALVGGTLVWAAPVVQTLSAPARAAGTAACTVTTTLNDGKGTCRTKTFTAPVECCECLNDGVNCSGDPCQDQTVIDDQTYPCP